MIYSDNSSTVIKLEEYITDDVTKVTLHRFLEAVEVSELEKNGAMKKLTVFVLESFKSHFDGRNNERVKKLDYITKDLRIPSRSGKDIANLPLSVSFTIIFVSLVKFYFIN